MMRKTFDHWLGEPHMDRPLCLEVDVGYRGGDGTWFAKNCMVEEIQCVCKMRPPRYLPCEAPCCPVLIVTAVHVTARVPHATGWVVHVTCWVVHVPVALDTCNMLLVLLQSTVFLTKMCSAYPYIT
jgi:hypothetical protein